MTDLADEVMVIKNEFYLEFRLGPDSLISNCTLRTPKARIPSCDCFATVLTSSCQSVRNNKGRGKSEHATTGHLE